MHTRRPPRRRRDGVARDQDERQRAPGQAEVPGHVGRVLDARGGGADRYFVGLGERDRPEGQPKREAFAPSRSLPSLSPSAKSGAMSAEKG